MKEEANARACDVGAVAVGEIVPLERSASARPNGEDESDAQRHCQQHRQEVVEQRPPNQSPRSVQQYQTHLIMLPTSIITISNFYFFLFHHT